MSIASALSRFCYTDEDRVCSIPQHEEHFHDIQDQWSAELHAHRRVCLAGLRGFGRQAEDSCDLCVNNQE